MQGIQNLPLFIDATDDELQWLVDHSSEATLDTAEYLFRAGDYSNNFYIVLEGELQITHSVDGEEIVLGTTPRGVMTGEYSLLSGTPHVATAQALMPTRLMKFELPQFLGIFTHCPSVGIKIVATAAERMQLRNKIDTQREKMAALGKLSAGLAHELNNPAAAARSSAQALQELMPEHEMRSLNIGRLGVSQENMERLISFVQDIRARMTERPALSALDRADREDELCDWLDDRGVDNYWEIGASFAERHVTVDDLQSASDWAPAENLESIYAWIADSLTTAELLDEIKQSMVRISDLIGAVKSYTYMDRGAYQEVDIHKDLDNTLLILKHRMQEITVDRRYDEDLPRLIARGNALNQVWTNLIDNAIDAMEGHGTLTLITRCENEFVMVEVADDGPGIPAEIQPRLFEPFFTTKEVGSGSGLGLDTSYRIISDHKGTVEVRSKPGKTRFIVRLPLRDGKDIPEDEMSNETLSEDARTSDPIE